MPRRKLLLLAALMLAAALPARASAFTSQCPTHSSDPPHLASCAPDVAVHLDTADSPTPTTGYIE